MPLTLFFLVSFTGSFQHHILVCFSLVSVRFRLKKESFSLVTCMPVRFSFVSYFSLYQSRIPVRFSLVYLFVPASYTGSFQPRIPIRFSRIPIRFSLVYRFVSASFTGSFQPGVSCLFQLVSAARPMAAAGGRGRVSAHRIGGGAPRTRL